MSLGRMDHFITLKKTVSNKDSDGFASNTEVDVASVRAYREGRHGSLRWANRAAFSDATELFQFRHIPDVDITTGMILVDDFQRFEITSVENVKGRDMYIEVLCREVRPSG